MHTCPVSGLCRTVVAFTALPGPSSGEQGGCPPGAGRFARAMAGLEHYELKEVYQVITLGVGAGLELFDTLTPPCNGINFSGCPPKESWKQVTSLSGGERALAPLSLVFALHYCKPTPLYSMDEVGAALDFRKVSIIANYIKERARNSQFIVIPLREHMFGLADLLVGFYEPQDVPQPVALNPGRFDVEKPFLQVKDANPKSSPTRAITVITRGASSGTGS